MWDTVKWVIGFLLLMLVFRGVEHISDGGGVKDMFIGIWEGESALAPAPAPVVTETRLGY
jgi:hypothetical protein